MQLEDPASEDVKDDDEKKTNQANDSSKTKLAGSQLSQNQQAEEEKFVPKKDYTLMDTLCQFLYEDDDPLPILTGYFLKVMEQLLDKQKQSTLEYLLLY